MYKNNRWYILTTKMFSFIPSVTFYIALPIHVYDPPSNVGMPPFSLFIGWILRQSPTCWPVIGSNASMFAL